MKAIVSQIIIGSFSSRTDGSLSLRAETPELTVTERVAFMELQGKNCRAVFEPMDYAVESKVEIKSVLDTKSPSQRLRAILFVLFRQLQDRKGLTDTWEAFYLLQMETVINAYKDQLSPEQ